MKKIIRKLFITLLAICLTITVFDFTGCEDNNEKFSDKTGTDLVIIVGRHANAKDLVTDNEVMQSIREMCYNSFTYTHGDTYHAQGNISVVVCDGSPERIPLVNDKGKEIELSLDSDTPDYRETIVNDAIDDVIKFLQSDATKADDPEVDLLSALFDAQFILDRSNAKSKEILILDSGICTTGAFDMNSNKIQNDSIEDIIGRIPEDSIPILSGVSVSFVGIGNVAEPQNLPNPVSNKLIKIWTKLLKDSCGVSLKTEIKRYKDQGADMSWYEDGSGYPQVSMVPFYDESTKNGPWFFPTSSLGFKPNSDVFYNQKQAENVIETIIASDLNSYLSSDPDAKVYVVGSIARIKNNEKVKKHSDVSAKRANKVASILKKKFGVSKEQIVIIDAGSTVFTWRNADEFPNGEQNDDNMQKNRVVAIIPATSTSQVKELRDEGFIK